MEKLSYYAEIANEIGDEASLLQIEAMKDSLENKNYVLSFMGQFSSGKSLLINCLLKRDILPVHITETTAVVTFIQHGNEEYAMLSFNNGLTKKIEISDIKELWQSGELPDGVYIRDIEKIDIYLNSDVLKNGLILADTPGVNTLVSRHEAVTIDLISKTEEIVYVMGKSFSEKDIAFIKNIHDNGISMSFVRTHMDEIKSTEEDINTTMREEKEKLSRVISNAEMFFISAIPQDKFYKNIDDLRIYIGDSIANNISNKLMKSCDNRCKVIENKFIAKIKEDLVNLENIKNNEKMDYENKIGNISIKMNVIKDNVENKKSKIKDGFTEAGKEAKKNINRKQETLIKKFKNYLDNKSLTQNYEQEINDEAHNQLMNAYVELKKAYSIAYDEFINKTNSDVLGEIDIPEVNMSDIPMPGSIDEIINQRVENNATVRCLSLQIKNAEEIIKSISVELENSGMPQKDYERAMAVLEEEKRILNDEMTELGPYVPKMYIDNSNVSGVGGTLRKVGNTLDWASLLIPGTVYEKFISKIGKFLGKGGKIVDALGKAAKSSDTIKDFSFALKNMSKTNETKKRTENVKQCLNEVGEKVQNNAGVLEMLTFEHWFGKLGDAIDGKPIERENIEYKNLYEQKKYELEKKKQQKVYEEVQLKEKYNLIQSNEDRKKQQQSAEKRYKANLDQELESEKNKIIEQVKNDVFKQIKEEYKTWYENNIESKKTSIINEMDEVLPNICNQYEEQCTNGIIHELQEITDKYNTIMNSYKALDSSGVQNKIERYKEYLNTLGA